MNPQWYTSTGTIHYVIGNTHKVWVDVDPDLARYYRCLIPKWISRNVPMYDPHISVVRKEVVLNLTEWGRFEGQEVKFSYSNIVYFGKVYCWLNVYSRDLEELRQGLGLPVSSEITRPPEGFLRCFHVTLANFKGL